RRRRIPRWGAPGPAPGLRRATASGQGPPAASDGSLGEPPNSGSEEVDELVDVVLQLDAAERGLGGGEAGVLEPLELEAGGDGERLEHRLADVQRAGRLGHPALGEGRARGVVVDRDVRVDVG